MAPAFLTLQAIWNATVLVAIVGLSLTAEPRQYGSTALYETLGICAGLVRIGFFALVWTGVREFGWRISGGRNMWIAAGTHAAVAVLGVEAIAASRHEMSFAVLIFGGVVGILAAWSASTITRLEERMPIAEKVQVACSFVLTACIAATAAWAFSTGLAARFTRTLPIGEGWPVLVPLVLLVVQILWALALDCLRHNRNLYGRPSTCG